MAKQKDSSGNFVLGDVVVAAGTVATQSAVTLTMPPSADALTVVINVSAVTGGTVTVTVSGLSASGYTWTILASTAIGTTGTAVLKIGRGLTAVANATANDMVPVQVQVTPVVSGTITYGIDYIVEV